MGGRCAYDRIATFGERSAGELHVPRGVAIGPDHRIFVADTGADGALGQLNVYDRSGSFAGKLSPGGHAHFQPVEVGVSADGVVYVLEQNGVAVHRFDAAGRYLGELRMPYGYSGATYSIRADHFAVQGDGTFWMLYRHGLVEHRDGRGALLGSFTVAADDLTGIGAANDGHVFVGRLNGGFTEYAANGAPLGTLNIAGASVAFAPDGDLVSGFAGSIWRINRDGTGRTEIGGGAGAPGSFTQVAGVAVAPAGALSAGRPGEQTLVVSDSASHRVHIVAPDGTPLAVVGEAQPSRLLRPQAAWGTPDGGMLVADTSNRRLVRFAATGAFAGRADAGIDSYPEAGAHNPATGDSVIIDGGGGGVRRFDAGGASLGSWPLPGGGSGFGRAITAADDGTVYVANSPTPRGGLIVAHRPDGTPIRTISGGHVDRPLALAPAPGGELFVVEGGLGNATVVDVFGPDGAHRRTMSELDCLYVKSIAVDHAGRIYAGLGDAIAVLDRSGALLARFGERGAGLGQFDGTRLSVLGNVLTIAETDNNRVTRVRIDATAFGAAERQPCGSVALATTTLTVKGASARVPLRCSGTFAAACDGSVAILRSSVGRGKRLKRKDVLARNAFRVAGAGVVALRLKKSDRRTLRSKRRLKARLLVRPSRGTPIYRRVTLRLPKARQTVDARRASGVPARARR